ncbi:MAG: LysM peptidoglycan-binding domain-containing protein [Byssovorax sp.]
MFTELANWFDKIRKEDGEWLDGELEPLVGSTLDESSPWYRNVAIYAGAGVAYSFFTLSTHVASGFVDVLRLGDGVKNGGWGYGQDALRFLMVVGPALKAARYGLSTVVALDELNTVGNCTWVAATRALRMTGVRHGATLADLARAAGLSSIGETGGAFVDDIAFAVSNLGGRIKLLPQPGTMSDLAKIVQQEPNAVTLFSVKWQAVAHTLLAFRDALGAMRILDRGGKVVSALAELESLYPGISLAQMYGEVGVIANARWMQPLATVPTIAHQIVLELGSVPLRPPAKGRQIAVIPRSQKPAGQGELVEVQNTVCLQRNSDVLPECTTAQFRTYKVAEGESLSTVARRVYGDDSQWPKIYAANRRTIGPNPSFIRPGIVLRLP